MSVKSIEIYYNTSGSDSGQSGTEWFDDCQQAGGPSGTTVCDEGMALLEDNSSSWRVSPSMTGGGAGVAVWMMIGREMLVGGMLAVLMAWTLF
jgi:hypothetical protein